MKSSATILLAVAILAANMVNAMVIRDDCRVHRRNSLRKGKWAPQCAGTKCQVKQCDDFKCWCVNTANGKQRFGNFEIALDEEYNCYSKYWFAVR